MKIYIIRHGLTEWNQAKRWQGQTDIALNSEGEAQALSIARRIQSSGKEFDIRKIYSSPLSRAYKTAEIISSLNGIPVEIVDGLKELNMDKWEGKTLDEILSSHGDEFYKWETEVNPVLSHKVETSGALQARAFGTLQKIARMENSGGNIVLVTHGAWIRSLIMKILNIDVKHKMCYEIWNAGLSVLDYNAEKGMFVLVTLNDVSHLKK